MSKPPLAVETPGGRMYVHPKKNQQVYSVTTILKGGIPKDLAKWSGKCSAQYVMDDWDEIKMMMDHGQEVEAFTLISTAHERVRDRAANKGDVVHDSAEALAQGKDDGKSPGHMAQLRDFLETSGLTPIYTELTVWNEIQGYAGTFDLLARDEQGDHYLIDYKTGNNVHPEHMVQLEALGRCQKIVWPDGSEEDLPHIDVIGVLHLRPKSWGWYPNYDLEAADRNWLCFLAAKDVSEWRRFHPDMVMGPLGRVTKTNWREKLG